MFGLDVLPGIHYVQCGQCSRWFFLRADGPPPGSPICDRCEGPAAPCDWCNGSGEGWDWDTWEVLPHGCTRCDGTGQRSAN